MQKQTIVLLLLALMALGAGAFSRVAEAADSFGWGALMSTRLEVFEIWSVCPSNIMMTLSSTVTVGLLM